MPYKRSPLSTMLQVFFVALAPTPMTCSDDSSGLMQVHKRNSCVGGDQSECSKCDTANRCLCDPNWSSACTNPGSESACIAFGGFWCDEIPPVPTLSPTPAPPVPQGAKMGEWVTCYNDRCDGNQPYSEATIKICFAGLPSFQENLELCRHSTAFNFLSIGGSHGFTPPTAADIDSLTGYDGISLDIEQYPALDVQAISDALTAAKNKGMKTHVTVAHTGYALTRSFVTAVLALPTLDYVSPQLYSLGSCISSLESYGEDGEKITWADWKSAVTSSGATAKILPGVPQFDFRHFASYDSITGSFCNINFGEPCLGVVVWPSSGPCNPMDRHWQYPQTKCGSTNSDDCSTEFGNAKQNGGFANVCGRCSSENAFRERCQLCCVHCDQELRTAST